VNSFITSIKTIRPIHGKEMSRSFRKWEFFNYKSAEIEMALSFIGLLVLAALNNLNYERMMGVSSIII